MKRIIAIFAVLMLLTPALRAEQKKLTEKEALQMLEDCRAKVASLNQEIADLEAKYNALVNQESDLDAKISALQNEIAELKAEIAKYPAEYTVQKGDYLSKIAAQRYIYNNWKAWPRIYRANRDLIKDPNLIYPGWVLKIPHGIVTEIEVIPGDCLWKISGFTWIYNNPKLWTRIYEANKDQIKDPNLIYPKQVLKIPR
jgi:nucleoid-associated protein YgaU